MALAVFLLGVTVLGLVARSRARASPAWWSPPSGVAAAGVAERTEQVVVNEAHRVREDAGEWWLELPEEGVNAWLAVRLPEWLESQDAAVRPAWRVGAVQAMFRPGLVVVGAEAGGAGERRVVSLGVSAVVDGSGRLVVTVRSASLGRLGLPVGWAVGAVSRGAGPRWGKALEHGEVVVESPELRLADGRRVRVVGLEVGDGVLRVRCRTLGVR